MTTTCPKCGYLRKPTDLGPDYACPSCSIVYAKYDAKADLAMRLDRATKTGNWAGVPKEHVPEEALAQALRAEELRALKERDQQRLLERQIADQERVIARQTLPLSTTPTLPDRDIHRSLGIVGAECAYGMNIFKDLFAGVRDVVGGRSESTQGILKDARRTVMDELRNEAFALGANAVVGVTLSFNEFSGGGKSMLFVVATGTAVELKPIPT